MAPANTLRTQYELVVLVVSVMKRFTLQARYMLLLLRFIKSNMEIKIHIMLTAFEFYRLVLHSLKLWK